MTTVSDLRSRVELYRPAVESDGQGGYDERMDFVNTVWAQVLKPRFWDGEAGGGPVAGITQGITIRYREDVGYDWQVDYKDVRYRIIHIEYGERRDMMTLTCTAAEHHG